MENKENLPMPLVENYDFKGNNAVILTNLRFEHLSNRVQESIKLGRPPLLLQICGAEHFPPKMDYIHHSALSDEVVNYLTNRVGSNLNLVVMFAEFPRYMPLVEVSDFQGKTVYVLKKLKFNHLSSYVRESLNKGLHPLLYQICGADQFPRDWNYVHHSALSVEVNDYLTKLTGSNLDLITMFAKFSEKQNPFRNTIQ